MQSFSGFGLALDTLGMCVPHSAWQLSGDASGVGPTYSRPLAHSNSVFFDPTYGYRKCRLVYNSSGADIDPKTVCLFKSGSSVEVLKATAAIHSRDKVAGVTPEVLMNNSGGTDAKFPNGYWGWLIYGGDVQVLAGAAITANDNLTVGATTAGTLETNALGGAAAYVGQLGVALTAAAAAGDTITARLALPD